MSDELKEYIDHGKSVQVLDTDFFFTEWGSGTEILVCLHGFFSSGYNFRKLAKLLSKDYKIIVPDLLGMGCSGTPSIPLSHRYQAKALIQFLETQFPEKKVHILCHDYGLVVTGFILQERPELIKSLSILNGFLDLSKYRFYFPVSLIRIPILGSLFFATLKPGFLRWLYSRFLASRNMHFSAEWAHDMYELLFSKGRKKGTLAFHRNIDRSSHVLRDLETGVKNLVGLRQILVSEKDPVVAPYQTELLKENLRTSSVNLLPSGHFVQEEDPELLANAVSKLLELSSRKKTKTFQFPRTNS